MTDSRRHILFAMTHSTPGGVREIWNDVSEGLALRGHRVSRFCFYPEGDRSSAIGATNEGWHHLLPTRARLSAMPELMSALISHLKMYQPASIVTAMPLANILVPLAVSYLRGDSNVVVTHHSPAETYSKLLNRLDGLTGALPCVTNVVSVSNAVATSLNGKNDKYKNKRRTIYNALPTGIERLIDELYANAPLRKVKGRIVAVGRLSHQKNYPFLIRAMAHVRGAKLDIIGSGEEEDALRTLAAEYDVDDRVRFMGAMTRSDVLAHCATANIFVQVSHYEGHSLALLEAARLGLPLIVSDMPVQVEATTRSDGKLCGTVVRENDDKALAAAITALMQSEELRRQSADDARSLGLRASNETMIEAYERLLVA